LNVQVISESLIGIIFKIKPSSHPSSIRGCSNSFVKESCTSSGDKIVPPSRDKFGARGVTIEGGTCTTPISSHIKTNKTIGRNIDCREERAIEIKVKGKREGKV